MREIQLTQGKVAIVDDDDFDRVNRYEWQAHLFDRHWYAKRSVRLNGHRTTQEMHRFIMNLECGDPHKVDHRNREETLDNRKENLRIATNAENCRHSGLRSNNTSGLKGVSRQGGKWKAEITKDGKNIYLGLFETPELAAYAYDIAAVDLFGEFAVTNAMLQAAA
jgi:hypothetical protein